MQINKINSLSISKDDQDFIKDVCLGEGDGILEEKDGTEEVNIIAKELLLKHKEAFDELAK